MTVASNWITCYSVHIKSLEKEQNTDSSDTFGLPFAAVYKKLRRMLTAVTHLDYRLLFFTLEVEQNTDSSDIFGLHFLLFT